MLDRKDAVFFGFISGLFLGSVFIGFVILPNAEESLEKISTYSDIILPASIGLLAVAVAVIGNKISNENAERDKYRLKWEKLTAWREMYEWMSIKNTNALNCFDEMNHTFQRISNYLCLSEDPDQPPESIWGSLIYFHIDDLSNLCKKLVGSQGEIDNKIHVIETNICALTKVTEVFFCFRNWMERSIKRGNCC